MQKYFLSIVSSWGWKFSFLDRIVEGRMSEWVAVCADETEEPVEIPTENDGKGVFLDKSCTEHLLIKSQFIGPKTILPPKNLISLLS